MPNFRQLLRQHMDRHGVTQLALGRSLGHARNGFVSLVLSGKKNPPLDDIEQWADALPLSADERKQFIRVAIREFAPPYVQRMIGQIDELKTQVAALHAQLARLETEVDRRESGSRN